MKRTTLLAAVMAGALCAGIALYAFAEEIGDITLTRHGPAVPGTPRAVFSHAIHRTQFRCYVCHEGIFKMQAGSNEITMDAVRDGKFCGVCHDGKTAFAVGFDTCNRCHASSENGS